MRYWRNYKARLGGALVFPDADIVLHPPWFTSHTFPRIAAVPKRRRFWTSGFV